MLIMLLLKFTNSVLGFIIFYYTVRGLCLVSLETVGECGRLFLTIQCFMYYGCFNRVMCHSICENVRVRTVRPKKRPKCRPKARSFLHQCSLYLC